MKKMKCNENTSCGNTENAIRLMTAAILRRKLASLQYQRNGSAWPKAAMKCSNGVYRGVTEGTGEACHGRNHSREENG